MKINLKFKALSVLMAGLQDTQKWVIYQIASGKNLPDSVTKADLIKILAFLLKQLDWIEDTVDSIEPESALHHDVAADTPAEESDCTQPVTSKSTERNHEVIPLSGAGAENLASNTSELNEKYNGETKTQHLRLEADVDCELESIVLKCLSNDAMEVHNDSHPKENCTEPLTSTHSPEVTTDTQAEASKSTRPMTSKSTDKEHEEILSSGAGTENLASNAVKLNDRERKPQHLRLETDADSPLDSIEQNPLSNDIMEVQNDKHPNENSFIEPLTTISTGNEHH